MHAWSGRERNPFRMVLSAASALALMLPWATVALASVMLTQISSDPFTNTTSQHKTEVEPDTYAFGSTLVAVTQVGRFFDGGSSDIGWATSTTSGNTFSSGFLPGITKFQGSGPYDRVSNPSVAFDAKHNVWLISSLALLETPSVHGVAVVVSRSTNGGTSWDNPVVVATGVSVDKNWTVCDNAASSPFYGHCYTEWDDNGLRNLILMSTSNDGGATWGAKQTTADAESGLGGQPVVQPSGTVVVPILNLIGNAIIAFISTNGGASWGKTVPVAHVFDHRVAGGLRTSPLPSAEIDGAGKVYVVWQDCRFENGCKANDIVLSTSTDGATWSKVTRIPADAIGSGVDHFIPGIAVDTSTSGGSGHVALTYYYYPAAACTTATCQLQVGFITSTDGGATWSTSQHLAGPMNLSWLANTSQGLMVGDYISTSFLGSSALPSFALAQAPSNAVFNEALYTFTGLSASASGAVSTMGERPVANPSSDHPARSAPETRQ